MATITIPNMSNEEFIGMLERASACSEALSWVGTRDLKTAWRDAKNFTWVKWLLCGNIEGHGFPSWGEWCNIKNGLLLEHRKHQGAIWEAFYEAQKAERAEYDRTGPHNWGDWDKRLQLIYDQREASLLAEMDRYCEATKALVDIV